MSKIKNTFRTLLLALSLIAIAQGSAKAQNNGQDLLDQHNSFSVCQALPYLRGYLNFSNYDLSVVLKSNVSISRMQDAIYAIDEVRSERCDPPEDESELEYWLKGQLYTPTLIDSPLAYATDNLMQATLTIMLEGHRMQTLQPSSFLYPKEDFAEFDRRTRTMRRVIILLADVVPQLMPHEIDTEYMVEQCQQQISLAVQQVNADEDPRNGLDPACLLLAKNYTGRVDAAIYRARLALPQNFSLPVFKAAFEAITTPLSGKDIGTKWILIGEIIEPDHPSRGPSFTYTDSGIRNDENSVEMLEFSYLREGFLWLSHSEQMQVEISGTAYTGEYDVNQQDALSCFESNATIEDQQTSNHYCCGIAENRLICRHEYQLNTIMFDDEGQALQRMWPVTKKRSFRMYKSR